jgi:2-polyprenyl-3-methyl-5-hydroxy-6-metoxy-1,4-benzoquinol methylase
MEVVSPITGKANIIFTKSVKTSEIIAIYKKILPSIDPTYLFNGIQEINVYECLDTTYQFYVTLDLTGDDDYYAKLGLLPWYYVPWKTEHEFAIKHIRKYDKVLEVGAAKGDFIKRIKETHNADVIGLELNSKAEEYSKLNDVPILNQTIQDYANLHEGEFDVVCSFQVLEHIGEVKSFIEAKVKCLKQGGKLIISVPNNDSFIGENRLNSKVLNQPPHHLGLWNEEALKKIAPYFGVTYIGNDLDTLQETHYETYVLHKFYQFLNSNFLVRLLWKLKITALFKNYLLRNKENVKGHSINAYYIKN